MIHYVNSNEYIENEKEKLGSLDNLPGSCCKRDYITDTNDD